MKHRSTNRANWARVPRQELQVGHLEDVVLVHLRALEVTTPLWVLSCGERIYIMDVGYRWLFICRKGAQHIVTAQCDAAGEPVQWYIDMVQDWACDESGFPCYNDLYLDVLALPDGKAEIIDAEELEGALLTSAITQAQYDAAWQEAQGVLESIQAGTFAPILETPYCLKLFER